MNLFSHLLGVTCASVIALGNGSVNAADMYGASGGLKDGSYVAAPTWTGFYAGINGGYSFGASNNIIVQNNTDTTQADIGQFYHDAGFGGGQIGYNWAGFSSGNQVVFGIETDIQGSGINGGFNRDDLNYHSTPTPFSANQSIDFFGTLRGRLGYGVGNALFYVTGGLAYTNVNTSVNVNNRFDYLSSNQTEVGWVFGGGVEYLFASCWSVKVEYQYIDLGDQMVYGTDGLGRIDQVSVNNNFSTVRAGINYHINASYVPLK